MERLQRAARHYLVLNSILAAVSGVVVATLATDKGRPCWIFLFLGMLALFLFLLDAEKTAEAARREDAEMFVNYHNAYNFAVTFLLLAIAALIAGKAHAGYLFDVLVGGTTAVVWVCGWGCDIHFLSKKAGRDYLVRFYRNESTPEDANVKDGCQQLRSWMCKRLCKNHQGEEGDETAVRG
ncbi:MAG: hypothetical protein ACLQF1_13370 [Methyloceanibacter sp.]